VPWGHLRQCTPSLFGTAARWQRAQTGSDAGTSGRTWDFAAVRPDRQDPLEMRAVGDVTGEAPAVGSGATRRLSKS
jgi:hypothetical protein